MRLRRPRFLLRWGLWPLMGCLLLAIRPAPVAAETADTRWQSRLDQGPPGAFPALRPFKASYRLRWAGLEAAQTNIDFRAGPGAGECQARVDAATVGVARRIWQLDATHFATAGGGPDFRPLRVEESETTRKRGEDIFRVRFEGEAAVRQHGRRQPPGSPEKADGAEKRFQLPGMRDIHTAFLYLRSLPLNPGEGHVLAVMSAKNPYRVSARVIGRGPLQVRAGRFPAIEFEVGIEKVDAKGGLQPLKRFESARAWISDDADRLPLKVETQIFIGRVSMELETLSRPPGL